MKKDTFYDDVDFGNILTNSVEEFSYWVVYFLRGCKD